MLRDLHEVLRRELQHEGHDADVGLELAASPALASPLFSDWNWNTGTPFSCAATFSASGRAPGFSGAQNTPATWSPRARNASSTALPKSC